VSLVVQRDAMLGYKPGTANRGRSEWSDWLYAVHAWAAAGGIEMTYPVADTQDLAQLHNTLIPNKVRRVKALSDPTPRGRLAVVLDTQNLLGGACGIGGRRVDYRKVIDDIVGDRPWTAVACVARPLTGNSIEGFVAYLGYLGVETAIWESPVACYRSKVNLDTLVIREAMRLLYTEKPEELCLAAGDVDYYVLADACAGLGVRFSVAGFSRTIGTYLRQRAGLVFELGRAHLGLGAE
jgi:NYN domain